MAGLLTEQREGESQEAAQRPGGRQGWGCAQVLRAEASLRRKHGRPLPFWPSCSQLLQHTASTHVEDPGTGPQHLGSRGTNSKFWCSSVRSQNVAGPPDAVSDT